MLKFAVSLHLPPPHIFILVNSLCLTQRINISLICTPHLPPLHIYPSLIGLQYGSTNNPLLAEKFFKEAISLAPEDPFVLAEMGALYLQTGKWEYALSYLQQVI